MEDRRRPKLAAILQESGRSKSRFTEEPAKLTAADLGLNDVILSNWNAFGLDPQTAVWPEETKTAYLDFVRRGKGHVVVHAGSASFPDWSEYGRLTLATWKTGQTSHGPIHEFPVRIENVRHPVTEGLEPFMIRDELWNAPGLAEGAEVLASSFSAADKQGTGRWEPAVLAGRFGEGRTLTDPSRPRRRGHGQSRVPDPSPAGRRMGRHGPRVAGARPARRRTLALGEGRGREPVARRAGGTALAVPL